MAEQEPDSTQERDVRLAYVTTGYPYVSQTFILREVTELRRLGVSIDTFAVWSSDETHILSMADQEAARTTYYIRPPHPAHFALALVSLLQTNGRWWRTLWRVLRRASSLRGLIWQLAYYVQAAVLWHQVRRRGLRHIHAHFANVSSDLAMIACGLGGPGWSWSFTMHGPTEFSDVEMFRLP